MVRLSEAVADKGKKGNWYSVKDVIGKTLMVTEDMGPAYDIRMEDKFYCIQVSLDGAVKDLHLAKGGLKAVAKAFASRENWKGGKFVITGVTGTGYQTETHVSLLTGDYAPGEQARLPKGNQFTDEQAADGARQQMAMQGVRSKEDIAAIVLYWCGQDVEQAKRVMRILGDRVATERSAVGQQPQTSQGATSSSSPGNIPVDPKAAAIAACLYAIKEGVGVHESRLDDMVTDICVRNGWIVSLGEITTALKYGGRIKNEGGVWKVTT